MIEIDVDFDPRMQAAKAIPQQPQAQYSTLDQFEILRVAANRLGLYDAAYYLESNVLSNRTPRQRSRSRRRLD